MKMGNLSNGVLNPHISSFEGMKYGLTILEMRPMLFRFFPQKIFLAFFTSSSDSPLTKRSSTRPFSTRMSEMSLPLGMNLLLLFFEDPPVLDSLIESLMNLNKWREVLT